MAAAAGTAFVDGDERSMRIEAALTSRFADRRVLLTTKDGDLVCMVSQAHPDVAVAFADLICGLATSVDCRVGIGRLHPGPAGVAQSYQEARQHWP